MVSYQGRPKHFAKRNRISKDLTDVLSQELRVAEWQTYGACIAVPITLSNDEWD